MIWPKIIYFFVMLLCISTHNTIKAPSLTLLPITYSLLLFNFLSLEGVGFAGTLDEDLAIIECFNC